MFDMYENYGLDNKNVFLSYKSQISIENYAIFSIENGFKLERNLNLMNHLRFL